MTVCRNKTKASKYVKHIGVYAETKKNKLAKIPLTKPNQPQQKTPAKTHVDMHNAIFGCAPVYEFCTR